jgi:hypothetical protein
MANSEKEIRQQEEELFASMAKVRQQPMALDSVPPGTEESTDMALIKGLHPNSPLRRGTLIVGRTSLWEAKFQELDEKLRASGRTVTVETDTSDDAECLAIFPPNRRTDK